MRTRTVLLASILYLAAAAAAAADPLPTIMPDHDFSGTYLMSRQDGTAQTMSVEYGAGPRTARIDVHNNNPGYILYDFTTQDAKMVMPPMQKYMDMPALSAQARMIQSGAAGGGPQNGGQPATPPLIQTLGTETIAGHNCRDTKITDTSSGHWSEICSTSAGIILKLVSDQGTTVVAQSISESPVAGADLAVPPGYTLFAMPAMPEGMQMPAGMPGQ